MSYTLHGSYRRKEVRAVSYMVARMQKMKADNLVGIGNHNQRKTKNHSNKDIDVERSHLNYDLVEGRTENYKTDIQEFIDENKSTSRAVRKDAVLVNEWIISSDKPFFEDKDDKETERFFREAKNYFADKFGDDNIRYAQVHLDETTPHMHLGVVPFDQDNKLSAKRVFNRKALIEIQEDLPKYLNERGFNLQRGEKGSERKHLSVPEYKKVQEEIKEMTKSLEQKKSEVLALSNDKPAKINKKSLNLKDETKTVKVPSGETIGIGKLRHEFTKNEERKTGNVILSEEKLDSVLNDYSDLYNANQQLKKYAQTDLPKRLRYVTKEHNDMVEKYNDVMIRHNNLLDDNEKLEKENKSLKDEIKGIYKGFRQFFSKSKGVTLDQVKTLISGVVDEVKEFVQGGEFERTHKNETRTRTRGRSR